MRTLVCGAGGCVGRAVVAALTARGHEVVRGVRRPEPGEEARGHAMAMDFMRATKPVQWAERLRAGRIDMIVNCVGILIPARGASFERVHAQGPIELFQGAALARVRCVVQVSALGVGDDDGAARSPYLRSKREAERALAALPLTSSAVLRPSLIHGPHSQSARLFATLAGLPVIGLPGGGTQQVQPVHVYEVAAAVVGLLERQSEGHAVHEIGGAQAISYRTMLASYRDALSLGPAIWLSVPMPCMRLAAHAAEALPQKVFSRDTVALLERGNVPAHNDARALLGRAPSSLAQGLAATPPEPLLDLRVQLSPAVSMGLRLSLAFMWLYTTAVTLLWPQASGVLELLARCGLEGTTGVVAMWASCALNTTLGLLVLRGPGPWTHAVQFGAVLGYTVTAALGMPELTLDHCGPLVKNVPVLGVIGLLWLALPPPVHVRVPEPGVVPPGWGATAGAGGSPGSRFRSRNASNSQERMPISSV